MKKIFLFSLLAFMGCIFWSCQNNKSDKVCHVKGTIDEKYNGKRIFMVPMTDSRKEVVDSVVIENGKFEFESDTMMIAKILVDYHFRMGTEPILIVVEPGEVNVKIGSTSSAGGTPQNDSLQQWKVHKQVFDQRMMLMSAEINRLSKEGKQSAANDLTLRKDSFNLAFKNYTRQMASNLKSGTLHDFLTPMYPKTYRRQLPDGTYVTIDADTNEQIEE